MIRPQSQKVPSNYVRDVFSASYTTRTTPISARKQELPSQQIEIKPENELLQQFFVQLQISQEEQNFAYIQLNRNNQRFNDYVKQLLLAADCQEQFKYSYKSMREARIHLLLYSRTNQNASSALISLFAFKTHVFNLVQQTLQARAISLRDVYLPDYTLSNTGFFLHIYEHVIPTRQQLYQVMDSTLFTITQSSVNLLNAWFERGLRFSISEKILCLMFFLGVDHGSEQLAQRFHTFQAERIKQILKIQTDRLQPVKAFEFIRSQLLLQVFESFEIFTKVPFFDQKSFGYEKMTSRNRFNAFIVELNLKRKSLVKQSLFRGDIFIEEQCDYLSRFYKPVEIHEEQRVLSFKRTTAHMDSTQKFIPPSSSAFLPKFNLKEQKLVKQVMIAERFIVPQIKALELKFKRQEQKRTKKNPIDENKFEAIERQNIQFILKSELIDLFKKNESNENVNKIKEVFDAKKQFRTAKMNQEGKFAVPINVLQLDLKEDSQFDD
ncbi:Conserved_hypothetical protein [Hexamita inflata]|uniref:Uncharacterized protein n=1 Tax=Hexamita inflata TaxID=28002 RepID=A0AA86NNU5_9EUKA|nr:Conserved hypothetical protein [Hexamita inflata]